jgi:HEAT repeat protein
MEAMRGCDPVYTAKNPNAFADEMLLISAGSQALGRIGPEALPALRDGLRHASRGIRRFTIASLVYVEGSAQALGPEVVRAINDRDPYVAIQACGLAVALCPQEEGLVPALERALHCREDLARAQAADALGKLGKEARPALGALLEGLHDPAPGVRAACVEALSKLEADPQRVVQPLLRLMKSEPEGGAVVQALYRYFQGQGQGSAGDRVVQTLVSAIQKGGEYQDEAARALGAVGPTAYDALPALKKCLEQAPKGQKDRLEALIRNLGAPSSPWGSPGAYNTMGSMPVPPALGAGMPSPSRPGWPR